MLLNLYDNNHNLIIEEVKSLNRCDSNQQLVNVYKSYSTLVKTMDLNCFLYRDTQFKILWQEITNKKKNIPMLFNQLLFILLLYVQNISI